MTLNRKLMVLLILMSLILIIPISFASDVDGNGDVSISNDDIISDSNELTQNSNEIYVNASSGSSGGSGSIEDPVSTIEEGLNLAGDGGTIYLTGEFSGDGNSNITFETPKKLTFIGVGNTIINGNHTTSFATINNGNYTFSNIAFINNYKIGGDEAFGGVFHIAKGEVKFDTCLFENNSLHAVNKSNGGAIDSTGTLTVTNCIFKNNTVEVSNSSGFRKNAADGGAISNLGTLYLYNTTFIENKAMRNGGAIRTQDGAKTYIDKCNFTGNVAAYHLSGGSYGGAIYTWDCALEVTNSIFKNNWVYDASGYGAHGGAISANRGGYVLKIYYCEFINNTADGVVTIDGQSLYFDSVAANVNYCTIDTGVYSSSKDVNLNYNWWVANNTNINELIEMLPAAAKVKTFAEIVITSDADEEMETGETINLTVKLCWNGTENQDNINLIPTRHVKLDSNCGILANDEGILDNGVFKTTITINNTDNPLIMADVDTVNVVYDFTKPNKTELSATNAEIFEGESATIFINADKNENGICLIDVADYKFYAELTNGEASVTIPNLKAGTYDVSIRLFENNFNEAKNITSSIIVKETPQTSLDTIIKVTSKITRLATDYNAGERGGMFYAYLTDINGNPLANKIIQIAVNKKIYNVTTDKQGKAGIRINLISASTYTYTASFKGDDTYNAAPLVSSKLTVTKKSTSIKASAKTFKAKAKTKKISVTLKTVKNKFDGKTYLKKGKKITLKINGKTYTAKTNAKGVAKFNIKLTKKGKFKTVIKFAGDKTYKASEKSIKITIK